MTKHRAVVAGYDSDYENPDGSTGRPKGVQTAADMRIATTYDVLAAGVFAAKGVPAITGSSTNTATISPFMAAIQSPNGGFYIVSIDAPETFEINLANTGLAKIFVQQKDWEVDNVSQNSEIVIGVVYGATAIPDGALQLFETTINAQTSTSGLTFNPVFKFTGAASGVIRVPTQADLGRVAVLTAGIRALVLTTGGSGTKGEYFYGVDNAWHITTTANAKLEQFISGFIDTDGTPKDKVFKASDIDFSSFASGSDLLIQTGTSSVNIVSANTRATSSVNFAKTYKTPPIVIATNTSDSSASATQVIVTNYSTSTTQASFRHTSSGYTGQATLNWIAIGVAA